MELSIFPLKSFEPYTGKTKKAIKKNTNLVEITHYRGVHLHSDFEMSSLKNLVV